MAEDIPENAVARVASGQAERRPDRGPIWVGLGLQTREILVVTLFTLFVVTTTTLFHLSYVTRLTLEETYRHAEVLARQFYGVSAAALARAVDRDPADALRSDAEVRSFVAAAVQYSPQVLYIVVEDQAGRAIVHSDRSKDGAAMPIRPRWKALLEVNPLERLLALYGGDQIYEVVLPLTLDRRPFASINVGIPLALVKAPLYDALRHSVILGGLALIAAWAVGMALSSLTLKPIRSLAEDMKRIRRGEVDVRRSLTPTDEFGRLAFQLQLLGEQIHSDRAASEAQRSRYQRVVDHLDDGLLSIDSDRRLQFANRAAGLMLGRPKAEERGARVDDLFAPDHPLRRLLDQAFDDAHDVHNAFVTVPGDGGMLTECVVSVFLVSAADGRCDGAMVLLRDVKSLTVSARTMESLISYSAHVAALGKASSEIAHEVKNPLNAMTIHLRLLRDQLSGAPETVKKSLDVIQKQIGRLDSVVQSFTTSIRQRDSTAVDLRALLREIHALLEAEWREKGVTFSLVLDPEAPSVPGNADDIRTAFMNIVLNACQAMPGGGGVSIAVERQREKLVAVTVSDTGTGIKPEDMSQMLERSFTTKTDGSGIGLSLVRQVIESHGGELEISSSVGRGTTVVVRLRTE